MTDVERLAGVVVSEDAARELVAALDRLDRLAAPTGMRLSPRLDAIRRELATSAAPVTAHVRMSTDAIDAQQVPSFELSVVDTTAAADLLGITPSGVTWLCRRGRLPATRTGGRWWVDTAALQSYREQRGQR